MICEPGKANNQIGVLLILLFNNMQSIPALKHWKGLLSNWGMIVFICYAITDIIQIDDVIVILISGVSLTSSTYTFASVGQWV